MITDLEEAHLHSVSLSTWFLVELEFGNVGFRGEGKTLVPGEKPLGTRERTNNKVNPRMSSTPGFSPEPHVTGWEACKCSQHFAIPVHRTRGMNMFYRRLFFPLFYTKKIGSLCLQRSMPLFICEIDDRHYFKSDEMQEILIWWNIFLRLNFRRIQSWN